MILRRQLCMLLKCRKHLLTTAVVLLAGTFNRRDKLQVDKLHVSLQDTVPTCWCRLVLIVLIGMLKIPVVMAPRRLLLAWKVLTSLVLRSKRVTSCTLTRSQLVARR